jgi:hypothetical protein
VPRDSALPFFASGEHVTMNVETIPLTDFQHDDIRAHEGRPIWLESGLAGDLERAGLLRVVATPTVHRVRRPVASGGARAAGEDASSSALPAAPVSTPTTVHSSERGATRLRANAR